jgi:rare lipoprotein A
MFIQSFTLGKRILKASIFFIGVVVLLSIGILVQAQDIRTTDKPTTMFQGANKPLDIPEPEPLVIVEDIETGYVEQGKASWYGDQFHGRRTANGETYNKFAYTSAHKTLPFGTICKVTCTKKDQSTLVMVNDRGPYIRGRIIDLSFTAAKELELFHSGVTSVVLEGYKPSQIMEEEEGKALAFSSTFEAFSVPENEGTVLKTTKNFTEAMTYFREILASNSNDNYLVVSIDKEIYKNSKNKLRPQYTFKIVSLQETDTRLSFEKPIKSLPTTY